MEILINTPYITLGALLKLSNIASSGGDAKHMILNGLVLVNGEEENRRGRKIYPNDKVEVLLDNKVTILVKEDVR